MIDLYLIIVAYRSASDLPALLGSVADAAGGLSWRAVIVDNYGLDGIREAYAENPQIRVVCTGDNLGYSGGLNIGVAHAPPSRFTIFLNPDLVLHPGSLRRLVDACQKDGVAATVPLVTDEAGRPQPSLRREPTTMRALGEALFGDHWPGRPNWLSEMVRDPLDYCRPAPIDWATGAALVVRSGILAEIGPWDSERFFLYSEETDYCRRIRAAGYRIEFVPTAVVRHRGAGSGSSHQLDALLAVNKVRYFRKWHGTVAAGAFFAVAVVHNTLRLRRAESRTTLRALFSAPARAALPGRAA